jgi:hypothetical protein
MSEPTTDPETIRQALAVILKSVIPTLAWQRDARWTPTLDREVAGTLRNFNLIFEPETEVVVNPETGQQGAYGAGIEYRCAVRLVVSYPVSEHRLPRFLGSDAADLSAVLVSLHEEISGLYPQAWNVDRRVVSTFTGSDSGYIGTHSFALHYRAAFTVARAS